MNKGIGQYRQIGVETALENASPHRLIQLLFEGALSQLANVKGAIVNRDTVRLQTSIKKTSTILVGLEEGLDLEKGGEIAANLEALYQYMQAELLSIQISMNEEKVDALINLLSDIKSGWDGISPEGLASSKETDQTI